MHPAQWLKSGEWTMDINSKADVDNKEENREERLNKWLSQMGVCSRREADRLIEAGKVWVDGCPIRDTGLKYWMP